MASNDRPEMDLANLLAQQKRTLLEARMLPNDGPLTDEQREEVRKALLAYKGKHTIGYKDIARQVGGITHTVVNQILKDTYDGKGKIDDHLRMLNEWMEIDARRRRVNPNVKFVEHCVARRIMTCADQAMRRKFIAIAHGPTGIGKTTVALVLAEKYVGAIYIRVSRGNTAYSALRRMLAYRLRLSGTKRRKADTGLTMDERIFAKLRDSHRLIIIDEAHTLAESGLDFLRDIYDECGVPMLLLATKDLIDRIRLASDEDHGQMRSRIGWYCELMRDVKKGKGGDRQVRFSLNEIRQMFEEPGRVRLASDALGFLQEIANRLGEGSLRTCRELLGIAVDSQRAAKGLRHNAPVTITGDLLAEVELQSRRDRSMEYDIKERRGTLAATA